MQRNAYVPTPARHPIGVSAGWQTRRWYYTPKSRRPYSVRQISPGDRRLLAEFALALGKATPEREVASVRELSDMLFDRVLSDGADKATGFAALEATPNGDRIIGVSAFAPTSLDEASFTIGVDSEHRQEQIGQILLATLIRQVKRVGVRRLSGQMTWSNRPMHLLAQSCGFAVEPVAGDRTQRKLVLSLK